MARLCLACAVLLAACLPAALAATDKTLKTVSGPCKDQFDVIMSEQYASDTDCPKAIKDAMSAAPADTSTCPGGGLADVGSRVQKCMSKDAVRAAAASDGGSSDGASLSGRRQLWPAGSCCVPAAAHRRCCCRQCRPPRTRGCRSSRAARS